MEYDSSRQWYSEVMCWLYFAQTPDDKSPLEDFCSNSKYALDRRDLFLDNKYI